jgi:hypothetical protein
MYNASSYWSTSFSLHLHFLYFTVFVNCQSELFASLLEDAFTKHIRVELIGWIICEFMGQQMMV